MHNAPRTPRSPKARLVGGKDGGTTPRAGRDRNLQDVLQKLAGLRCRFDALAAGLHNRAALHRYAHTQPIPAPPHSRSRSHMRSRLPMVWSSRCSVNVAALSTLVSFSREILPQRTAWVSLCTTPAP